MTFRKALAIANDRAFDFCGSHDDDSREAVVYLERNVYNRQWHPARRKQFKAALKILRGLAD